MRKANWPIFSSYSCKTLRVSICCFYLHFPVVFSPLQLEAHSRWQLMQYSFYCENLCTLVSVYNLKQYCTLSFNKSFSRQYISKLKDYGFKSSFIWNTKPWIYLHASGCKNPRYHFKSRTVVTGVLANTCSSVNISKSRLPSHY